MVKSRHYEEEKSAGDFAVDGLLGGIAAGFTMALFLVLAGMMSGTKPSVTLGYFDPAQAGGWLAGLPAHLAVSAVYGAFFSFPLRLLDRKLPAPRRQGWLWGVAYGLLLYVLATELVLNAVASPLTQIAAWQLLVAHLLYGGVLGWWLQKTGSGGGQRR